ncbi:protein CWC15 homolog [Neocloeon triangulifer]|uniref:protein CWC15 homolog n=1 Tax=Neocloeon triangulifer TaxID=2078957 RepID=UPI00286F7882|nr:protein CWC15 homolog [Neocloeon triangulifer]
MTTAARPTFEPARGGTGRGEKDLSALSKQYSARDLPSHTKLKYREHGQGTSEEIRGRDFRKDLEDREKAVVREKRPREHVQDASQSSAPMAIAAGSSSSTVSKRPRTEQISTANLDADDPLDDDDSDASDSDEDDTAQLLAELNRIKKERAAENTRKEAEKRMEEERIRMENILSGNPLLNYSAQAQKGDLKVKRRWDDDVVFKNCARSEPSKNEPQFINDSLRSEFHRKFMEKYIK